MASPADNPAGDDRRVVVGRISGIYGIHGGIKIFSHTRPKENILEYSPWLVESEYGWCSYRLEDGQVRGKGLVARLEGVSDREQARALMGCDIAVSRSQLPDLPKGEYYWCDLIGLTVLTANGDTLGSVIELQETGANDVLVIEGRDRHLVPLVMDTFVRRIDLEHGRIVVDWDSEWTQES